MDHIHNRFLQSKKEYTGSVKDEGSFYFGYLAAMNDIVEVVKNMRLEGIPIKNASEFLERCRKLYL